MMLNDLKSRAKFIDKGVMGIFITFDYFLNSPNGRWSSVDTRKVVSCNQLNTYNRRHEAGTITL
jgi:hypothetical protein